MRFDDVRRKLKKEKKRKGQKRKETVTAFIQMSHVCLLNYLNPIDLIHDLVGFHSQWV